MTRFTIASLVFMMAQAMTFFVGAVLVLATPLADWAWSLMPWVVALSIVVAAPVSWFVAPMLRARYWGRPRGPSGERRPGGLWAG